MPLNQGTYSNNEEIIYQYLMSNGFNLAKTCGILANLEAESNFNPRADSGSPEYAYGICQWRDAGGPRKSTLFQRYNNSPTLENQLRYIMEELHSTESNAKKALDAVTENSEQGARDAAKVFASKYERCHSSHYDARVARASKYWEYYQDPSKVTLTPAGDLNLSGTSTGSNVSYISQNVASYNGSLTDAHNAMIQANLDKVAAEGYDYGYLIDMTNGGEFKFYIPEFQEVAGSNWTDIPIPGRSVSIKAYNSTNSRVVTVSLDLYAGAGLYNNESGTDTDIVGTLHKDVNFVKSLEYPDYSHAIIRPPATVHLILGSSFNIEGVVSGVTVQHMKPLDDQNRSMYIKLSFTVTQTALDPPSYHDLLNGTTAIVTTFDTQMADYASVGPNSPSYVDTLNPQSGGTNNAPMLASNGELNVKQIMSVGNRINLLPKSKPSEPARLLTYDRYFSTDNSNS